MTIRDFQPSDSDAIVEILKANQQYDPINEGPEAMLRVNACKAAQFLVAEKDGRVVGMIRGVYDGSRALIHIASVHPKYQRQGIGTSLVKEITRHFKGLGAADVAVTVPGDYLEFWKQLTFRMTTRIMVARPIDNVLSP